MLTHVRTHTCTYPRTHFNLPKDGSMSVVVVFAVKVKSSSVSHSLCLSVWFSLSLSLFLSLCLAASLAVFLSLFLCLPSVYLSLSPPHPPTGAGVLVGWRESLRLQRRQTQRQFLQSAAADSHSTGGAGRHTPPPTTNR